MGRSIYSSYSHRLIKMAALKTCIQILAVIFICFPNAGGIRRDQTVYLQRRSIVDYLYKYDLPALTDFSYCMWLNFAHGLAHIYPITISSSTKDNHHAYAFWSLQTSSPVFGHCGDLGCRTGAFTADMKKAVEFGWHKHCFVYKNGDHASWYMDRDTPGVLIEMDTGITKGTIVQGAALLILQEQDSFKGGLDASQVGYGKFSMFNMWNYAMTLDELNALGCNAKGNVVNMDNLDMMGHLETITEEFECSDVAAAELRKDLNAMMFCRKPEQQLSDVFYVNMTTVSVIDCAKKCAYDTRCQSANYISGSMMCQLNSVDENDETTDLESASGVVHLSSVGCY